LESHSNPLINLWGPYQLRGVFFFQTPFVFYFTFGILSDYSFCADFFPVVCITVLMLCQKNTGNWWPTHLPQFINSSPQVKELMERNLSIYSECLSSAQDWLGFFIVGRFWNWHEWQALCLAGKFFWISYQSDVLIILFFSAINWLQLPYIYWKPGYCQIAIHRWEEITCPNKEAWKNFNGI
jgi:hypothetical protein